MTWRKSAVRVRYCPPLSRFCRLFLFPTTPLRLYRQKYRAFISLKDTCFFYFIFYNICCFILKYVEKRSFCNERKQLEKISNKCDNNSKQSSAIQTQERKQLVRRFSNENETVAAITVVNSVHIRKRKSAEYKIQSKKV